MIAAVIEDCPNAWDPAYLPLFNYLPLLGSLSAFLTLVWVALLLRCWQTLANSRLSTIGWLLFATAAIAFVPYANYWNMLDSVL